MKQRIFISACISVALFTLAFLENGCHFFDVINDSDEAIVKTLTFNQSSYTTQVNNYVSCLLTILPSSVVDTYSTEWTVEKNDIAEIEYQNNTTCMLRGKKAGTTIITAKIADAETKTAIIIEAGQ